MKLPFLRPLALAALLITGIAGCSKTDEKAVPENRISFNDFEAAAGWIPGGSASLTTEKAHSGRYAVKVDKSVEFSLGYANLLSQVSPQPQPQLTVTAWVNLPNPRGAAMLVAQVLDPATSQQIFWEGLELGKEVKTFNRWVQVSRTFTLPATVQPTQQLRIYLWRNAAEQPVYLDDIDISRGAGK